MSVVDAQNITQGYGPSVAIRDLSLCLGPGVHALLGPNGAGKTTLLRTLATVVPARSGSLAITGTKVTSARAARRVRRQIGYLPQDFGYFPTFTVRDFVHYCGWLRGVPRDHIRRDRDRVIESVGLSDRSRSSLKSLSGGMLRRAGVAGALLGSPALVLLDEPTVGFDPEQRLDFREMIRGLTDACIVLSTHLVEDVAAMCEQVVVMEAGTVLFTGSPADLALLGRDALRGDSPIERGYVALLAKSQRRGES